MAVIGPRNPLPHSFGKFCGTQPVIVVSTTKSLPDLISAHQKTSALWNVEVLALIHTRTLHRARSLAEAINSTLLACPQVAPLRGEMVDIGHIKARAWLQAELVNLAQEEPLFGALTRDAA